MIDIIGAPFDFGGGRLGSRLGPTAIRLANLSAVLGELGFIVRDRGDVGSGTKEQDSKEQGTGFPEFEALMACIEGLRRSVEESLAEGNMPIALGGEHTVAAGAISAATAVARSHFGVLWIDAHGDINTPATSMTGNIHGMPLGALRGLPAGIGGLRSEQWDRLVKALGPEALAATQIAWYALRQVDSGERERVLEGFSITMPEIDRYGIEETVSNLDRYWRDTGVRHLWISFDIDALDPILAPGSGTTVRGGLTYREAHLLAELLRESLDAADCPYKLMGMDLCETNPLADTNNETAIMAVEWIASLLGKRVL